MLFGADCDSVVYPCHSLVVDMEIASRRQRFFIGHTDKVAAYTKESSFSPSISHYLSSPPPPPHSPFLPPSLPSFLLRLFSLSPFSISLFISPFLSHPPPSLPSSSLHPSISLSQVSCLSLNHAGTLLASGQTGPLSVVRVWKFETTQCLAMFKTHSQGLHTLRSGVVVSFPYH